MDEQTTTAPPDAPRIGIMRSLLRTLRQRPAPRPDRPVETVATVETVETVAANVPEAADAAAEADASDAGDAGKLETATLTDYGEVTRQVRENYEPMSNTFDEYRGFVRGLEEIPGLEIVPVAELALSEGTDRRLLALRHDVDNDPVTALRIARFLASRGIGGSFYLLPTARYYGEWVGGGETGGQRSESVFVRSPALAGWVRGLVVAGCEIGLHNDALATYLEHGVEPEIALREEIDWLRSAGAVIRGSVAHNSAPAYGAANSEVFAGRTLWPREARSHDGRPLPIGSVDERSLGLEYEGTFAVPKADVDPEAARRFCYDREGGGLRSEPWMRRFLLENPTCDWDVDLHVWVIGRNEWVVAGRAGSSCGEVFDWCVGRRDVLERIAAAPPGTRCLVVLHPEYFLR